MCGTDIAYAARRRAVLTKRMVSAEHRTWPESPPSSFLRYDGEKRCQLWSFLGYQEPFLGYDGWKQRYLQVVSIWAKWSACPRYFPATDHMVLLLTIWSYDVLPMLLPFNSHSPTVSCSWFGTTRGPTSYYLSSYALPPTFLRCTAYAPTSSLRNVRYAPTHARRKVRTNLGVRSYARATRSPVLTSGMLLPGHAGASGGGGVGV
eukprot:195821-Rhodomonas_salina.4